MMRIFCFLTFLPLFADTFNYGPIFEDIIKAPKTHVPPQAKGSVNFAPKSNFLTEFLKTLLGYIPLPATGWYEYRKISLTPLAIKGRIKYEDEWKTSGRGSVSLSLQGSNKTIGDGCSDRLVPLLVNYRSWEGWIMNHCTAGEWGHETVVKDFQTAAAGRWLVIRATPGHSSWNITVNGLHLATLNFNDLIMPRAIENYCVSGDFDFVEEKMESQYWLVPFNALFQSLNIGGQAIFTGRFNSNARRFAVALVRNYGYGSTYLSDVVVAFMPQCDTKKIYIGNYIGDDDRKWRNMTEIPASKWPFTTDKEFLVFINAKADVYEIQISDEGETGTVFKAYGWTPGTVNQILVTGDVELSVQRIRPGPNFDVRKVEKE